MPRQLLNTATHYDGPTHCCLLPDRMASALRRNGPIPFNSNHDHHSPSTLSLWHRRDHSIMIRRNLGNRNVVWNLYIH